MGSLVDQLAPYQFLVAFSQIISRVCHNNNDIFKVLEVNCLLLNSNASGYISETYSEVIGTLPSAVIVDDDSCL